MSYLEKIKIISTQMDKNYVYLKMVVLKAKHILRIMKVYVTFSINKESVF